MFNRGRGGFGGFDKGFGFDRGFGGERGFGPGGPRFERGDIKYVILDLLKDKPRHGYDIIQELKKQFSGFYNPSAGTIYPTLQLLEDQDLIVSEQKDGKKVYTVTAQGMEYLKEHQEEIEALRERMRGPWGENAALGMALRQEFGQTVSMIFAAAGEGKLSQAQIDKIQAAFRDLHGQVEKIIAEG